MNRVQARNRASVLATIFGIILCVFWGGCAKVTVRVLAESPGSGGIPSSPKCDLEEKSLDVQQFKQETGQWCWAASAQMVMNHHRKLNGEEPLVQCEIVNRAFTTPPEETCCPDGLNDINRCHQGWWVEKALKLGEFESLEPKQNPGREELWNILTSQICANQPVIYENHFQGGGGHSNVIYGYRGNDNNVDSGRWVEIYDPQTEPGSEGADQTDADYLQMNFDEELVFVSKNEDTAFRQDVYYIYDIQPK